MDTPSRSGSASAPPIRAFQIDANATGNASDSVNLFRGDVNFPLQLVSLDGPNGLDLKVQAYYSGALGQQADLDNLQAPTGVLGLGWSLGFEYIEFQAAGTSSYLQGRFIVHANGDVATLILLEWLQRGTAQEELRFANPNQPLWQYHYFPHSESWQVLRDDGACMLYGDREAHPDAVQWAVRWDNWTGSSAQDQGNPQPYAIAWNLATVRNQWGNTLHYQYRADQRPVVANLTYTRASYIDQISDAYGRTVSFEYADKNPVEYQPPHTVAGQAPDRAYQDRYETLYLQSLSVRSPAGALHYCVHFDSEPIRFDASGAGSKQLNNTSKRYLLGVRQARAGHDVLPPVLFAYDWRKDSPSRGRVLRQTYPSGGVVNWSYRELELGEQSFFSLDYTAQRPTDPKFKGAEPRLWFGSDYVLVVWYAQSFSLLQIEIYQYGGRWSEAPFQMQLSGVAIPAANAIRVAFGQDFFALHFHNNNSNNDTVHVFQKIPYQFGRWDHLSFPGIRANNALSHETSLVAGDDFIAIHPGGVTALSRMVFDRRSRQWWPQPGTTPGSINGPRNETRMALAAGGNLLAVGFFSNDTTVSAMDQLYWLDTGVSGTPQWQSLVRNPSAHGSFAWDASYVFSYLRLMPGFIVGSYPEGQRTALQVTQWQRNFSGSSQRKLQGDALAGNGLPAPTEVTPDSVINGGMLYRYNGAGWVSAQYAWNGRAVATQSDQAVAARLSAAGFDARTAQFNPLSSAAGEWRSGALATPNPASADPAGPQFSGRYFSLGANLYWLDTDGGWHNVSGVFSNTPGNVVANHGPNYVAYETTAAPNQRSTQVALLLNAQVDGAPITLPGQRIGDPAENGVALTGPSAFATYPSEFVDLRNVPRFTLHRILNRQVGGYLKDCVVDALVIDSGEQQLHTVFQYDTASAVFDASGQVAQYPKVVAERRTPQGASLGATEYHYFNGLEPLSTSDSLNDSYSLAAGYQAAVLEYAVDEPGAPCRLIGQQQLRWLGLSYSSSAEGGFSALHGIKTIRQHSESNRRDGLHLIQPALPGTLEDNASLSFTTTMSYLNSTGAIRSRSLSCYDSQGQLQQRETLYRYAWEVYPAMAQPSAGGARQLSTLAQTTLLSNGEAVQSYVTSFKQDWSTVTAWGAAGDWRWLATTTVRDTHPEFNFSSAEEQPGWLASGQVLARNSAGLVTLSRNAQKLHTYAMYGHNGLLNTANIINSNGEDASFSSFEDYESSAGWSGGSIVQGDAHSGNAAVHLQRGESMHNSSLRSAAGQTRYVLAAFVKANSECQATLSLQLGTGAASNRSWAVGPRWQYVWLCAEGAGDGSVAAQIQASIRCDSGATLLVDDVQIAALQANATGVVYDPATQLQVASVGQNGQTSQTIYDPLLNPIGLVGPDEQSNSISLNGYARDGLDMANERFNSLLECTAMAGGVFDDFRDANWQQRWSSSNPQAWQVVQRSLRHRGSQRDMVTLRDSDDYQQFAVLLQVDGGSTMGDFGLALGGTGQISAAADARLTVQWNQTQSRWQILDGAQPVASFTATAVSFPAELFVLFGRHSVTVWLDRQQIMSYLPAPDSAPLQGALSLFSAAADLGFRQVLVLQQPKLSLSYLNGLAQAVQTQQWLERDIVVAQSFYDALGRVYLQTKPAIYLDTATGFRSDFASPPDPAQQGRMTGYVSRYYDGSEGRSNDEGYPYSCQRFELSAWGRLLESGLPGAALAIRPGNPHTTRYLYGTNAAQPYFAPAPAQQYAVDRVIDADGLTTTTIKDVLGNLLGAAAGSELNTEVQLNSVILDGRDNPIAVRNPNWYAPPSQGAEAYLLKTEYDVFGQICQFGSSDTGDSESIYDSAGNLRFELIADSRSSDPAINPAAPQLALRYRKYDGLNRQIEQGWVAIAQWDRAQLQSKADSDWPQQAPGWRFRYHFDRAQQDTRALNSDSLGANLWGRLGRVETQQADGSIVSEDFRYDLAGNVIQRSTHVPGAYQASVDYQWNHIGKVTHSRLPSLTGAEALMVERQYDARGLVQEIRSGNQSLARYEWNAAGEPARELLGDGAVSSLFTYTSAGQPQGLDSRQAQEQLYYDSGNGTARFNGLLSQQSYAYSAGASAALTAEPAASDWLLDWDNAAQLSRVEQSANDNLHYQYDGNGNVLSVNGQQFHYQPGSDQLRSISGQNGEYRYSPSGNRIASPQWQTRYDFVSNLVTSQQASTADARQDSCYGATAQRLVKRWSQAGAEARRFYVPGAGQQSVVESTRNSDGSAYEMRYIYGPSGIVAIYDEQQRFRYTVRDYQRSLRQVVDHQGIELARFDYAPFGALTQVSGSEAERYIYRYTGQEWDGETGLYNYRHRLYDPVTLCFIATDPARQFFSPYVFVGNNPLQNTDPSGEFSLTGFLISAGELLAATVLTATGVGAALAVPLWGAGIAGAGYSIKTDDKDFNASTFAQVQVGGAIGATEIAAGIAITVLTDGAGGAIGGGSLIGAGFSGLIYSTTAGNDYNWKSYAEQQLIGAVGGLITGGFGAVGGTAAGAFSSAAAKFATEASFVFLGGVTSSMTSQAIGMAFDGMSAGDIFSSEGIFSTKNLLSDLVSGGLGVLGSAAGKGIAGKLSSADRQSGVLYRFGSSTEPVQRMPVLANVVRTGSWSGNLGGGFQPQFNGWTLLSQGAVKRIPKVVTPLAFNAKKLWT